MVRTRYILALSLVLALTACTKPITQRPTYTAEELEAERILETNAATTMPLPPVVEPVYPNQKMKRRLQSIVNRIAPAATKLCYAINGPHKDRAGSPQDNTSCTYSVGIKGVRGINAYADGRNIIVTAPMMAYLTNDTQLAMVIAHEYGHNIMEHRRHKGNNGIVGSMVGILGDAAIASTGVNSRGSFSELGNMQAQLTFSPEFEQEADYVGLYIMARAGYTIDQLPAVWRNMARSDANVLYIRTTHPTSPERFVGMSKAVAEIRAKQRAKEPLIPNIQKET